MEDKFENLFPCGVDFDTAGSGTLMQNRCSELGREQIDYIENATVNFSELYEMLGSVYINFELGDRFEKEIESVLKRARGE